MFDIVERVYTTGERFTNAELNVPRQRLPGGPLEDTWWDLAWQRIDCAHAGEFAIITHAVEITAQVRARREIELVLREAEAARAVAEAANRGKSEFLAIMSHELRTPLNAIDGYAELMQLEIYGEVTAEQRAALERMRKSQRHLLGLINDVLNFTRVEGSRVAYAVCDVPVRETLATCDALTAPQRRARDLAFRAAEADPRLAVRADQERMQQILINLLSNAIKFTNPGGRITLECTARRDVVDITVGDTGRGIPADQLSRVFEPFVQADAQLTRTQEGIGLGLAISRELARGMGGDLLVESELGAASIFTLRLPRAEDVAAPGDASTK